MCHDWTRARPFDHRRGVASKRCRLVGVAVLRDRGLISSQREGSGHRRFQRASLRRIAFIVFAQRVGPTLDDIGAELARLPVDAVPTRRDWSRLAARWKGVIEERIVELERLKGTLTECIGCGCLSMERCKLSNPGDRAGDLGSGPRYWMGDRAAG